jgi:hypothetical protein
MLSRGMKAALALSNVRPVDVARMPERDRRILYGHLQHVGLMLCQAPEPPAGRKAGVLADLKDGERAP